MAEHELNLTPENLPEFEPLQGQTIDTGDTAPVTPEDYLDFWKTKLRGDHVKSFDEETGTVRHYVTTGTFKVEVFGLGEGV